MARPGRIGLALLIGVGGAGLLSVAAPATAQPTNVTIQHYMYMPSHLSVAAGDTVTWTNQDEAPHTITGTSGPAQLDSPQLAKGEAWSFTFSQAGTYTYYCAVHPDMKAEVTVAAPTPAPAPAPAPVQPVAVPVAAPRAPPMTAAVPPTTAAVPPTTAAPPAVVPIRAVTTTSGPRINPMLVLAAVAAGLAVFAATTLAGPRRPKEE